MQFSFYFHFFTYVVSIPLSQVSIKSNTLLPTIESLSDFEEEGEVDESFEERDELDKDYQPSGSDSEREIDSCSENQALYKDSVGKCVYHIS